MYDVHSSNGAFQELFNRTPHPMFAVDRRCRIRAANPAAQLTYGYTAAEFSLLTIADITAPSEHERLHACFSEQSSASVRSSGRWSHLSKDGMEIRVDITSYSLTLDSIAARMVLAIDVTEQVRAEEKTSRYVAKLEAALNASVHALGSMVELGDPYTAGHQKRVSRLAVAIAREMKLDESSQAGIGVMALVHDIGKIGIPGGILNKPSSLTPDEYELVKCHSRFGYDILTKLEFDWPVAECVLQHHERLDGSGYPGALRVGDIRPEAKILAVADVMESISSHRPYRAAMGDRKALEEVVNGSGRLYDPDVVNAATALMNRGYSIL